jgi:hypothetical protein
MLRTEGKKRQRISAAAITIKEKLTSTWKLARVFCWTRGGAMHPLSSPEMKEDVQ